MIFNYICTLFPHCQDNYLLVVLLGIILLRSLGISFQLFEFVWNAIYILEWSFHI